MIAHLAATKDANGQHGAFDRLYERFRTLVYTIARSMGHDIEAAEELVQDVFVDVIAGSVPDGHTDSDWRRWLATLAHNRAVNVLRDGRRRRAREERAARPESQIEDKHAVLELQEDTETMLAAIAQLPEQYRSAVSLKALDGLTYEDVAAILGKPEGTVKTHVRHGLRMLRSLLETGQLDTTNSDGDGSNAIVRR